MRKRKQMKILAWIIAPIFMLFKTGIETDKLFEEYAFILFVPMVILQIIYWWLIFGLGSFR
jgi:hypothetical protein